MSVILHEKNEVHSMTCPPQVWLIYMQCVFPQTKSPAIYTWAQKEDIKASFATALNCNYTANRDYDQKYCGDTVKRVRNELSVTRT